MMPIIDIRDVTTSQAVCTRCGSPLVMGGAGVLIHEENISVHCPWPRWENQDPTEPGWYFHRAGPGHRVAGVEQVVQVPGYGPRILKREGSMKYFVGTDLYSRLKPDMEWFGPVAFPPE